MWKAAIVGLEKSKNGQIRACLEQTGLVESVVEWNLPKGPDSQSTQSGPLPNVVVLNLAGAGESALSFAADLRKTNTSLRILACSPEAQPDSKLLLAAMRSGVQEILSAPLTATAMQEALLRFHDVHSPPSASGQDKTILVMGSKGGVGTSSLSLPGGVPSFADPGPLGR